MQEGCPLGSLCPGKSFFEYFLHAQQADSASPAPGLLQMRRG